MCTKCRGTGRCSECGGSGKEDCDVCKGAGRIGMKGQEEDCHFCNGTGKVKCSGCAGSGICNCNREFECVE